MARYTKSGSVNTVQEINSELEKIATAQEGFVSRSGETPNEMLSNLDMNSNRITNLPAPTNGSDAARFADVGGGSFTVSTDEALVFDNILEMTTADLAVGQYVRCKRYYSGGDLVDGLIYEIQASASVDGYIDHTLANGNIATLIHSGTISIKAAGFVADGTEGSSTGTDNSLAFKAVIANSSILNVLGDKGVYYFGELGLDEALATRTSNPIHIDWRGAYLIVNGDSSIINTGMTFLELNNVSGSMVGHIFEDVGFSLSVTGRGVVPLSIVNDSADTSGYTYGDCHIVKGQSLLTVSSPKPYTYRASDITFTGAVTGGEVYYGVNLAGSGDRTTGVYSVDSCNRLVFIYAVEGVDLKGYCETGSATSGSVNISNTASVGIPTKNCVLDMAFGTINGPVLFNNNNSGGDVADDGEGEISDISLRLSIDTIGTNALLSPLVIFRDYDSTGGVTTGSTSIMDGIILELNAPIHPSQTQVSNISDSPNFGSISLVNTKYSLAKTALGSFTVLEAGNKVSKNQVGSFATPIPLDISYIVSSLKNLTLGLKVTIYTKEDNSTFAQKSCISELVLLGYVSSGGAISFVSEQLVSQTVFGAVTPTFTVTPVDSRGFDLTVSGYTNGSDNSVTVTVENTQ